MIRSNRFDESAGELLSAGLEGIEGDVFVINPTAGVIEALVDVLGEEASAPRVRLFAAEEPLKGLIDDFLIASSIADLVGEDRLAIRLLDEVPTESLLVSRESVVALVSGEGSVAGLAATDDDFVAGTCERYERRWADAEEFGLRTPALSRIRKTLEAEIGPETAADFDRMLAALDAARGDGDGLDEVAISLLVAARNGQLLYDISKWGEDVGLASKATFSRTKTRLEEAGLVDTEKVPIDVGRPRLRLMLGDDRLAEADVENLATTAETELG